MGRHFFVVLAGNGVGGPFRTLFKHASTLDKVFSVGHWAPPCGVPIRLAAIPSSSPPAQIIVWRLGCWPLSADQSGGFFFWFCWARSVDAAVRDALGARPK